MSILVTGSHGCIGTWVLRTLEAGERPVAYDLSEDPWRPRQVIEPGALDRVTVVRGDAATEVPVAGAYDDGAFQRLVGPLPRTGLREGVRQTVEHFERLRHAGRLDTRELGG